MSAPAPAKYAKTLRPTADKRRERRDEKAALDPTSIGDARNVKLKGGVEKPFSFVVQRVYDWLRDRDGHFVCLAFFVF